MSGAEHMNIASAQLKETVNENSSVLCSSANVDSLGNKGLSNPETVECVPNLFFDSAGDRLLAYENSFVDGQGEYSGDITNWEVGIGEGLNPVQTVGEVFDILDSDFRSFGPPQTGNSVLNSNAAQGPEYGVRDEDISVEQLPVGGFDSRSYELRKDGVTVMIPENVETPGKGFGPVGEMPHIDGGARTSVRTNEQRPLESLSHGKDDNQNDEPVEGGVWASVCEVAKESDESLSLMPRSSDQDTLFHESEACEPSVLKEISVECAKTELIDPELVTDSIAPGQNDMKLAAQISSDSGPVNCGAEISCVLPEKTEQGLSPNHIIGEKQDGLGLQSSSSEPEKVHELLQNVSTLKEDGVHDSSKNDNGTSDDLLNVHVHTRNVVSDCNSSRMTCSLTFEESSNIPGEGTRTFIEQTEQKEPVFEAELDITEIGQNPHSKVDIVESSSVVVAESSMAEQVGISDHDNSSGQNLESKLAGCVEKAGPEQSRPSPEELGGKEHSVVLASPAYDASQKTHHGLTPKKTLAAVVNDSSGKRRRGRSQGKTLATPVDDSSEKGRLGPCLGKTSATPANNSSEKRGRGRPPKKTLATPSNESNEKRGRGRPSAISTVQRDPQQSLVGGTRVLRSKVRENSVLPEPTTDVENAKGSTTGRRGRKKRTEIEEKSHDEFSKMRSSLKYLLHKIQKEQHLLEAYSNEGWRGQSIEKLRPEKELERAKADINRSKLKIRDFFQRLEQMCSEGKFPDSLYDSEGLIDSEDIFCAKCGSKDLPTGNDIILCDGICDRGFHQYCLVPPLLTEEIPPGDEGWLCPACDCKVDCIDLLNDTQGTKLSVEDSWEKFFPEAVAATAGREQDDLLGLPSDDSEDNDYNPEGPDDDAKVQGTESSSDESDDSDGSDASVFSAVNEDLGDVRGNEQHLGLPSDDSEDNDYDPDAANIKEDDKCESSSSDFTSASEDLGATVGDDGTSDKEKLSVPIELDQNLGDSQLLSGRRHVERLDYQKLYEETYKNAGSDSSDDDEWTDRPATRKRKSGAKKDVPVLSNGNASFSADGTCPEATPRRRGRSKVNCEASHVSPAQIQETPQETSSSGKGRKRPPYNKLGEAVTQRLYESFKENHYPDRSTKAKLAEELGLTLARVDKWFGNARWSLNHHPTRIEAVVAQVVPDSVTPQSIDCNRVESSSAQESTVVADSSNADTTKLDTTKASDGKMPAPRRSRKRKKEEDAEPMSQISQVETCKESTPTDASQIAVEVETHRNDTTADPLQTPQAQVGRVLRKRTKPGA